MLPPPKEPKEKMSSYLHVEKKTCWLSFEANIPAIARKNIPLIWGARGSNAPEVHRPRPWPTRATYASPPLENFGPHDYCFSCEHI